MKIAHRYLHWESSPEIIQPVKRILDKYNIKYEQHVKFDGLLGLKGGQLSYDFLVKDILIEYQGQFHDGTAPQQSEEDYKIQQEHDRRKREYANKHNIKLLEIWYWDFDNVEKILNNEININ